jgi:vesicle coat complex subunit
VRIARVQLIVLDRLVALRSTSAGERVLQDCVMDILRVLAAPDLDVRRKTLALALDLVSSRNVDEMVMFLRKVRSILSFFFLYTFSVCLTYCQTVANLTIGHFLSGQAFVVHLHIFVKGIF